jgi:hypothetical protein
MFLHDVKYVASKIKYNVVTSEDPETGIEMIRHFGGTIIGLELYNLGWRREHFDAQLEKIDGKRLLGN